MATIEEMQSSNSFFPFIEKQKRDVNTSVGMIEQERNILTLESENDMEISIPYNRRSRSKSKSNNFEKKTSIHMSVPEINK